jgi:hypothetical protein
MRALGARVLVTLKVGHGGLVKVAELASFKVGMGEKVGVHVDLGKAHVFDRKTGQAIL